MLSELGFVVGIAGAREMEVAIGATAQLFPISPLSNGIGSSDRLIAFDRVDMLSGTSLSLGKTSSGHTWTQSFGSWQSANGRIYSTIASGALAYITIPTSNIDLSAGVKYANREFLAIRATDKYNFIGVRLNHVTGNAEIYKMDTGVSTTLAQISFVPSIGRRYLLNAKVYGPIIDFYVDGKYLISYTLSAGELTKFGAIVNHGIGGNSHVDGLFDNIEFRNIE